MPAPWHGTCPCRPAAQILLFVGEGALRVQNFHCERIVPQLGVVYEVVETLHRGLAESAGEDSLHFRLHRVL